MKGALVKSAIVWTNEKPVEPIIHKYTIASFSPRNRSWMVKSHRDAQPTAWMPVMKAKMLKRIGNNTEVNAR